VKPVLVDTSVWRKYFAGVASVKGLADLLEDDGSVLVHPFVVGEMVLGGLSRREEELFARLPGADLVPHASAAGPGCTPCGDGGETRRRRPCGRRTRRSRPPPPSWQ